MNDYAVYSPSKSNFGGLDNFLTICACLIKKKFHKKILTFLQRRRRLYVVLDIAEARLVGLVGAAAVDAEPPQHLGHHGGPGLRGRSLLQ